MSGWKKNLLIVAAVLVVAIVWAWYDLRTKPANERIQAGIRKLVAQEPRVKPAFDQAMADGVLTTLEAKEIADRANALKGK